jgi:hypothetical protein
MLHDKEICMRSIGSLALVRSLKLTTHLCPLPSFRIPPQWYVNTGVTFIVNLRLVDCFKHCTLDQHMR